MRVRCRGLPPLARGRSRELRRGTWQRRHACCLRTATPPSWLCCVVLTHGIAPTPPRDRPLIHQYDRVPSLLHFFERRFPPDGSDRPHGVFFWKPWRHCGRNRTSSAAGREPPEVFVASARMKSTVHAASARCREHCCSESERIMASSTAASRADGCSLVVRSCIDEAIRRTQHAARKQGMEAADTTGNGAKYGDAVGDATLEAAAVAPTVAREGSVGARVLDPTCPPTLPDGSAVRDGSRDIYVLISNRRFKLDRHASVPCGRQALGAVQHDSSCVWFRSAALALLLKTAHYLVLVGLCATVTCFMCAPCSLLQM